MNKVLIALAVFPVIVLLLYIYKKDSHKEPMKVLIRTFFLGVATIIPAAIAEIVLGKFFPTEIYVSPVRLFINTIIGIALIEEIVKCLVIKVTVYKANDFDESFDGIVYAVFASLGFACLENIMYVLNFGFVTGLLRIVTAVPLHACTGIIMGYYIGKAKINENKNKTEETVRLVFSLVLPTIIHGIYDFLIISGNISLTWVIFTLAVYVICFVIVRKSAKSSRLITENIALENITTPNTNVNIQPEQIKTPVNIQPNSKGIFCRNCGSQINDSNFCSNCGKKNE